VSRPLRIAVPDGVYHVVARGNAKQLIFLDDADRLSFLEVVERAVDRFQWCCLSYCLMPNHYHLVLQTPNANLSRGMRQVNGTYAQRFNRRHGRCGHLFQGRFGATLVETDRHILELIRYVANNPVRAGLARRPEEWRWSGHAEVIGISTRRLVSTAALLAHFGSSDGIDAYREFIAAADGRSGAGEEPILGGSAFVHQHLPASRPSGEMPKGPWRASRPKLTDLLTGESTDDAAIANAYRQHGYTMKQISEALGCHYATVSRRIRRFEELSDCKT
jgi:putative transposase